MNKCKHCFKAYTSCPYYCSYDDTCWPNPAEHMKVIERRKRRKENELNRKNK